MKKIFLTLFLYFSLLPLLLSADLIEQVDFSFNDDPIDIIIPCVEKDLEMLELCIAGIKKNYPEYRRIIVISKNHLTENAEWFNEADFPFSINDIKDALTKKEPSRITLLEKHGRLGWYYQQLLKLYTLFVIPDISSNILILDSDTIFRKPVKFLNDENAGLYNYNSGFHTCYFNHAHKLFPHFQKHSDYSGITHHMVFQKSVLEAMFKEVETYHNKPFWQIFCHLVDQYDLTFSGASEYEIYFNYVFSHSDKVQLRKLKFGDTTRVSNINRQKYRALDYISIHSYGKKQ